MRGKNFNLASSGRVNFVSISVGLRHKLEYNARSELDETSVIILHVLLRPLLFSVGEVSPYVSDKEFLEKRVGGRRLKNVINCVDRYL